MVAVFTKATKQKQKLRTALVGPPGAGKTWTAQQWARFLAGNQRFALIDSEHGSASLYADEFDFDTLELDTFDPELYVEALRAAAKAKYPVVVIDSLSHAWSGVGGALDQVDALGGKFQAWRTVTPKHNELVEEILKYPGHIIATMRAKVKYEVEERNESGGKRVDVKKLGLAPIMREGVEYEFTMCADLDTDHTLKVSKSRIKTLPPNTIIRRPDAKVAEKMMTWLENGEDPNEARARTDAAKKAAEDAEALERKARADAEAAKKLEEKKSAKQRLDEQAAQADAKVKERRTKAILFVNDYTEKLSAIASTCTNKTPVEELKGANEALKIAKDEVDENTRKAMSHFEPRLVKVLEVNELIYEAMTHGLAYDVNDEEKALMAWFDGEVKLAKPAPAGETKAAA